MANIQLNLANDVLERLFKLDECIANARAFRAQLERLDARPELTLDQIDFVGVVTARAALLRSLLGAVMAALDAGDHRGNRAALGQLFKLLRSNEVIEEFERGLNRRVDVEILLAAEENYKSIIAGEAYKNARRLRNDEVSHLLLKQDKAPTVESESIIYLHDKCEALALGLFAELERGEPQFRTRKKDFDEAAEKFWKTYFKGLYS